MKGKKGFQKGHGSFWTEETKKQYSAKHKGIKLTEEHKAKIGLANKDNRTGLENGKATRFPNTGHIGHQILGSENKYRQLHKWVESKLGKPNCCESCEKIATGKSIHWANISGEYKKEISDWKRLCTKCHYEYDLNRHIRVRDLSTNNLNK